MSGGLEGRVRAVVAEVRGLAGVGARAGVSAGDLVLLEERLGCYLPAAYRALLGESNGIELGYGFDRWLGYGPGAPVDVVWWNDPGTWKWAYAEWDTDGLLDVWREVSRLGEGDEVTGVELWRDGEGRQRLRFQIRRAR